MSLKIFNSLTRKKEVFTPMHAGKVNMYVCGMTVYDFCHLGHARVMVVFDVVSRYLRSQNFDVTYVRNITDIDDKIILRANEENIDYKELTKQFIVAMHEDEQALNVLPPDQEPKATEYIEHMIAMIQKLIDGGFAYAVEGGDVYFDVSQYSAYGRLSQQDLQGLQAGARVDVGHLKHDAQDFVLWKSAKKDEPHWESPWGSGRPGWHIECSAMSTDCLGAHFDLHGGGFDLQFPHHENEIAQSECSTGEKFVNYWMHVGFLQINSEKMSKSLGNFFRIRDVLAEYSPEVVRYFLIASHYRSLLNYSLDNLTSARAALERFYTALDGLPKAQSPSDTEFETRFLAAMNDDFNTPEALAVLFDIVHHINQHRIQNRLQEAAQYGALLIRLAQPLGILQLQARTFLQSGVDADVDTINDLIKQRNLARIHKNYRLADELRQKLHDLGVELEDNAGETTWRRLSVE